MIILPAPEQYYVAWNDDVGLFCSVESSNLGVRYDPLPESWYIFCLG